MQFGPLSLLVFKPLTGTDYTHELPPSTTQHQPTVLFLAKYFFIESQSPPRPTHFPRKENNWREKNNTREQTQHRIRHPGIAVS
jgi:hypothetical protein